MSGFGSDNYQNLEKIKMNREELEERLCDCIVDALQSDIEGRGAASLLVSGGSTPKNLFAKLSQTNLNWSKVVVSLVDERFLPDDHKDQNGNLVKESLLINNAAAATFVSLVQNAKDELSNLDLCRGNLERIPTPFSVVVLGMGTDGHTASLFPGSPQLNEGMDLTNDCVLISSVPTNASYQRITFTRKALLNTKNLILHCYGEDKEKILNEAKSSKDWTKYPISGFIHQDQIELKIFWSK
jgi:6-phosphogluconolactonase